MKPAFETIDLNRNEDKKRFEIVVNGHFAFIDYKKSGNKIALIHTEVDEALAGTGSATAVVVKTLQYIKDGGFSLLPYCSYVFAYIKKHPEWKAIVDPSFPAYDSL